MKRDKSLSNVKNNKMNDYIKVENIDAGFDFDSWLKYHQYVLETKEQVITEYTKLKEEIISKLGNEEEAKELDAIFCNRKGTTKPSDIQELEMRAIAIVSIMANRISWQLSAENANDKEIDLYSRIYTHANIIVTENSSPMDRRTYDLLLNNYYDDDYYQLLSEIN